MAPDYISIARVNRVKALAGLSQSRDEMLAISGTRVHRKASRRKVCATFISSRCDAPVHQTHA